MNEKLIDNTIQDYSLRELQIYSSKILSVCGATNSFITQFKADNDSQQFYFCNNCLYQKTISRNQNHFLVSTFQLLGEIPTI